MPTFLSKLTEDGEGVVLDDGTTYVFGEEARLRLFRDAVLRGAERRAGESGARSAAE